MRAVSDDLVAMVKDYPADLKLAEKIKAMLEDHYDFLVPASRSLLSSGAVDLVEFCAQTWESRGRRCRTWKSYCFLDGPGSD